MSLYLQSCDKTIKLETNSTKLEKFFISDPFPYAIIPNFKVGKTDVNSNFTLIYNDDNKRKIKKRNKIIEISGKYHTDIPEPQFVFLALICFEKIFQENEIYSLHAAAIEKNDNCTLLVGDTFSGKTSVVLECCLNHDFKYISDERTVIRFKDNKVSIEGGNELLSARKGFLQEYLKNNNVDILYSVAHDKKEFFQPEDCGMHKSILPKKLKNVVYIGIDKDYCNIEEISPFSAIWHLYRDLSFDIRTVGYGIFNFPFAFPSFDNEKIANRRLRNIKNAIEEKNIRLYEIRGPKEKIADAIDDLYE